MTTQKSLTLPQLQEILRLLGDDYIPKKKVEALYEGMVMQQLEELGNSHHIVSIDNVNCIVQYASVYYLFNTFLRNLGRPIQHGLSMAEIAGHVELYFFSGGNNSTTMCMHWRKFLHSSK